MKPVFEIIPEAIFFHETNLICEISPDSFSYVFENDVNRKFHGLSVFHFEDDKDYAAQLQEIFNEQSLLHKKYKQVFIAYLTVESLLLPEQMYKPGNNSHLLDTLIGDTEESAIATDLIADKKIYNIYKMPAAIRKIVAAQFPLATFSHYYSILLKDNFQANILKVIFYKNRFVAAAVKDGELQIIQTYPYHSGTDVVYHLLNLCSQINMINVPLQIGGMIDFDSDLHKEIAHYFPSNTFSGLPAESEFVDGLKQLPSHYFSHLFSPGLCV